MIKYGELESDCGKQESERIGAPFVVISYFIIGLPVLLGIYCISRFKRLFKKG